MSDRFMSALGQKRTYAAQKGMSALPPIATSIAFFGMSALGQKRTSALNSITSSANQLPWWTAMPSALMFKAKFKLVLPVRFVASSSLGVVTSSNVANVNPGGLSHAIVIRHSCRSDGFDGDRHRARHRRPRRQRQHAL